MEWNIDRLSTAMYDENTNIDLSTVMYVMFKDLPPRTVYIIIHHQLLNESLDTLSSVFDLTRERIRQIEMKGLRHFRLPKIKSMCISGIDNYINTEKQNAYKSGAESCESIIKALQNINCITNVENASIETQKVNDNMDMLITEMDISCRLLNCLKRGARLHTIQDIVDYDAAGKSFIDIRNMGKHTYAELINKLNELGVVLKYNK